MCWIIFSIWLGATDSLKRSSNIVIYRVWSIRAHHITSNVFKVLKLVICKNFGEIYIFSFNSHTLATDFRFDLKKKLPEPHRLPSYDLTALGTRFCSTVQCDILWVLSNQQLKYRCKYVSKPWYNQKKESTCSTIFLSWISFFIVSSFSNWTYINSCEYLAMTTSAVCESILVFCHVII